MAVEAAFRVDQADQLGGAGLGEHAGLLVVGAATWSSIRAGRRGQARQIGTATVHSASRSGVATPPDPVLDSRWASLLVALLVAAPASASEPLCNSLSGLGNAAQALWLGDPGASVVAARAAWSALPRGPLGARAAATLGQALLQADRPAEAIAPLTAALASPQAGL